MRLRSLAVLAVATIAAGAARAGECPPDTWELANGDCDYEIRCVHTPRTNSVEIVVAEDPTEANTVGIDCDACDDPGPAGLNCLITQGFSYTETGSVSYSTGWEAEVAGTVNVALAGAVGVHATTAFSQGQTNETSMTEIFGGECGVTGLSCANRRYELSALRRTVTARLPVYSDWEYRYTGGPEGCSPSGWLPLHPCPNVTYDTISADDFLDFRCKSIDRGPCCTTVCPCCTDVVPHQ